MLHSVYDQPDAAAVNGQIERLLDYVSEKLPAVADHLDAARADHPGPDYVRADLTTLDLESAGTFDAIVCAGNVITFVAPGAEVPTLISLRRHLAPDGVLVVGFQAERYAVADFDRDLEVAGLVLEHRFATWHLGPWSDDAEFAVSVIRDASRATPPGAREVPTGTAAAPSE
jgi:SAM-dependent methyltransferase